MSQIFKSPLTTPGLIGTLFPKNDPIASAAVAKLSPPPPPPTMAMPPPPGEATLGYTPDDPRWKKLQKAGSGDTILTAPGAYSGKTLGG